MNRKTNQKINIVACAIAVAFLIFIFIYPHHKLKALSDDIAEDTQSLIVAVQAGQWGNADALMDRIEARFMQDANMLRFFLDHEDVDQMQAVIKGAHRLVEQRDDAQILFELEHIINIAVYIRGIESFSFYSLF